MLSLKSLDGGYMHIDIADTPAELGKRAAEKIAELIGEAVKENGEARIILSTGMSQFDTLASLVKMDVEWNKVEMFHLDEYVGISPKHPASFRKYLTDRFVSKVSLKAVHFVGSESIEALSAELESRPVDIGVIGIGENGHIAFNDPPADFDATDPYIVVDLERRSKRQQVNEGWFGSIEEVPDKAITMSIHEILSSRVIVCACPDQRKAKAVASCIFDDITPASPCSSIRKRTECTIFLDRQSSRLVFEDMRTT